LVSSGSHQGNSDLSAEVRLLGAETNPQGLDLAFRVRRPVAARFFAMFAKVGTTEAGSHAVAREERGEWSGRVHGPNGVGVWIRVADLRAAKNGEWAVTCGCHYRQCPAGHPTFPSRARHKQGGREREQSVPSMSCSQRVPLEIVDLPGIKINEAKPRRLSLMTQRVHSMRVGGTRMHPSATGFSGGADVTAFGGPGLVIFTRRRPPVATVPDTTTNPLS
jgi:hypothetical protein